MGWSPGTVSLKPGKVHNVLQRRDGKPGGPRLSRLVWERWGAGGTECSSGQCSLVCKTQSLPDFVLGSGSAGRPGAPEFKIPANSISVLDLSLKQHLLGSRKQKASVHRHLTWKRKLSGFLSEQENKSLERSTSWIRSHSWSFSSIRPRHDGSATPELLQSTDVGQL